MWGLLFSPGSAWRIAGGVVANDPLIGLPILTWDSAETDNEPDFQIDLPSGNGAPEDAAEDDHLIIQYQLQSGGSWTEYIDHTLTALNISDDTISVSGVGSVPDGDYYFRCRIERGSDISAWSSNVEVTISTVSNGWNVNFWWR